MFEYSPPAGQHRTPGSAVGAGITAAAGTGAGPGVSATAGTGVTTAGPAPVGAWIQALAQDTAGTALTRYGDPELINTLRSLEDLKAAASAAQARITAAFDASQRRQQAAAGVPRKDLGRGIAAQIALARRESPNRGGRLLGLAKALTTEMPHTLQALTQGRISEWRATLLVRETACLDPQDRAWVDAEVAGDLPVLETLGDRQIISRTRAAALRLDPQAAVDRAAKAVSDRFVSCRPAPDTMTYLTGLLPVAQGVGVFAALSREADRLRAAGDGRGRGQIMADTLVERVTGQAEAGGIPVQVQLVMTERSLLGSGPEPALVPGYGPVPAQWARDLIRSTGNPGTGTGTGTDTAGKTGNTGKAGRPAVVDRAAGRWIRRLYTDPVTGGLVAMDSRARLFPRSLARFIAVRDQTCRTPWCGAPIRQIDHIQPHHTGGATSAGNGQGLCQACNQAKEAPGWTAHTTDPHTTTGTCGTAGTAGRHTVRITTPTGHTYESTAPPLPGSPPPATPERMPQPGSLLESGILDLMRAA